MLKTCACCGKTFKIPPSRIKKKFCSKKCQISNPKLGLSQKHLYELYWIKLYSLSKISSITKVPIPTIYYWMNKYNIPTRQKNPRQTKCDYCGKEFLESLCRAKRKFKHNYCSMKCYGLSKKQEPVDLVCRVCGKNFTRAKWEINRGRKDFCSHNCFGIYNNGEKNPNWKGGWEPYYGPNWNTQRVATLKRDNYKCVNCGSEKGLNIHHTTPFRLFGRERYLDANSLSNLTTLCISCHSRLESGGI